VEIEGALARAATARAHLNASKAQLELSRLTLVRHQSLASNGHVSTQRLDELVQQHRINEANLLVAQTQLSAANAATNKMRVSFDKTILKAPYAGTIQSRSMDEGSIVSPGATVISLIERGFIEARIGIPESMIHLLTPGRSYEFVVGTRHIPGKLKAVLPQVDDTTGTITSIFSLDSTSLYAGSLAELQLAVEIFETGYWIPLTAIAESQRGLWSVLVVVDSLAPVTGGSVTVETRLVEIIHHGKDAVFVRGTLRDGDLVVNNGVGRIVPGQSVSLAKRYVKPVSANDS
jgi:RND family efflux transporter MFP subunit